MGTLSSGFPCTILWISGILGTLSNGLPVLIRGVRTWIPLRKWTTNRPEYPKKSIGVYSDQRLEGRPRLPSGGLSTCWWWPGHPELLFPNSPPAYYYYKELFNWRLEPGLSIHLPCLLAHYYCDSPSSLPFISPSALIIIILNARVLCEGDFYACQRAHQ